ncbi:hypothetical protein [Streptomyces erythrochromogenes]|uniref:hypothetical protein n=1 Tax=Streptomyces erythrochromogenes TaxID=285574 RepID=UPI0033E0AF1C
MRRAPARTHARATPGSAAPHRGTGPPLLLREEVYATAALAGAAVHLGLHAVGVGDTATTCVCAGPVFALRMTAVLRDLHLPRLRYVHD